MDTHRQMKTQMIQTDLRNKGFDTRHNLNGDLIVSLARHLGVMEVQAALYNEGYDNCQFTAKSDGRHSVIVAAC